MRAVCWNGVNDIRVERVPDPGLLSPGDVILVLSGTVIIGVIVVTLLSSVGVWTDNDVVAVILGFAAAIIMALVLMVFSAKAALDEDEMTSDNYKADR